MAHADEPEEPSSAEDASAAEDGDELNVSIADVLDLMSQEIERLQVALETYRLSDRPDKEHLVRWHVQQIDERQDRLEEMKQVYLAQRGADGPTH